MAFRKNPAEFCGTLGHRSNGSRVSSPTTRSIAYTTRRMRRASVNTRAREASRPTAFQRSAPSSVPRRRKAELKPGVTNPRRPDGRRPTIGVFDSGVGGLTVLRALLDRIPAANYLYFVAAARLPYGSKSAATVAHYAVGAIRHLQSQGAELLVIACNTATAGTI